MKTRTLGPLLIATALLGPAVALADGEADEAAVRVAIASYTSAFNAGDAAAVASHWSPAGEFLTPSGKHLRGREEIQKEFEGYFADSKDAKLQVNEPSLQFLSPGVAMERGTAVVVYADGEASSTDYEAVHVKTAEGWKMDSVREQDHVEPQSQYERLKELEWMVGTWVDEGEGGVIETTCRWTTNQNFLTRNFKVYVADRVEMEGTQVIGWDPIRQTIRSWVFDSEGGFGVGQWSRNDNRWTVQTLHVLATGEQATAINIFTRIDDDTCTFQSVGRQIDGELQPNVDPVKVVRQQ